MVRNNNYTATPSVVPPLQKKKKKKSSCLHFSLNPLFLPPYYFSAGSYVCVCETNSSFTFSSIQMAKRGYAI